MPTGDVSVEQTSAEDGPRDRVFSRLLYLLRPQWPSIALGLFLLLLAAPCELFPAMAWMYAADHIILNKDPHPWLHRLFSLNGTFTTPMGLLGATVVIMTVIYLVGEVFETIQQNIMNRVAQRFIYRLRNDVYHKLQSQSLGYLQRQRTGDLMSRAISDIDEIQTFIVNGIDVIVSEGLLWTATIILVFAIDWRVAGGSLAPLILVYILLRIFNSRIKPIYNAAREAAGNVATRLQENLSGVVVIKIFNREKQEAERFQETTQVYYDKQIQAINARSLYFPFARIVGFFSNVAMLGLGGFFILYDGSFTVGKLLAFRAYWWRLFGPVQTLARVNDMVHRAIAAARRVFEVLDAEDELPDAPDAVALPGVRGSLELRNVSFVYPSHERTPERAVLRDISLTIDAGQTVALAGPSGSGKSTVLNLLVRFYDPKQGQVLLDNRDLRSIRRDHVRKHFALVQQETFLFNDSILDNIRYGQPDATMEQVIAAAKAANAHHFITQLPNSYETKVGERGVRLSGGQKQRISIARAFLADPRILLLDEPTSSVEPESEAAIIAALNRLMTNRTTVLTSHRPSLIQQADWVYVIEDGQITECGPPGHLAGTGNWFTRFMRSAEALEPSDV